MSITRNVDYQQKRDTTSVSKDVLETFGGHLTFSVKRPHEITKKKYNQYDVPLLFQQTDTDTHLTNRKFLIK